MKVKMREVKQKKDRNGERQNLRRQIEVQVQT
jgi:hypothetical protein